MIRNRWHNIGITAEQLRWYGHVLRKKDDDWVKKCMEYEVAGPGPRGRQKRTWRGVVEKNRQALKLNKEDAMDRSRWRKLIKDVWWTGWVWVGECFFWYQPTRVVPDERPLNGCVCVCHSHNEHTDRPFHSVCKNNSICAMHVTEPNNCLFNGFLPRTSRLSWHHKSKPVWTSMKQETMGCQWH